MSVCGVTSIVWADKLAREVTYKVAERFEKLNGMPVRVISEGDLPGFYLAHSHFARYYMWDILPQDVDQVVYFDPDVIPLRKLPELPSADLAAASEAPRFVRDAMKWWRTISVAGQYFSSGVLVAKRSTRNLFLSVIDRQTHASKGKWPYLYDQTLLNLETQIAVKKGEITFELLPGQWNYQIARTAKEVKNPYILHYGGMQVDFETKMRTVRSLIDRLEEVGV